MRLLAVVGTDHHPFERLVRWVDLWSERRPDVECLIQYGTATPPRHATGVAYLRHEELGAWMDTAEILVSHGGPSTILECRGRGRVPVVVPRSSLWGEHVDNHQVRFTNRLADMKLVLTAGSQQEFDMLLDKVADDPSVLRLPPSATAPSTDATVRRFGELVSGLFRS